jgi:hypothetical protein
MRTKDYRRHQEEKKKRKVVKDYDRWWWRDDQTPRMIGIKAHTPALCSCYMCGNPRKYWKEKTIQERRNEI